MIKNLSRANIRSKFVPGNSTLSMRTAGKFYTGERQTLFPVYFSWVNMLLLLCTVSQSVASHMTDTPTGRQTTKNYDL